MATSLSTVTYTATLGQTEFVLPFDYVRGTYLTLTVDGALNGNWSLLGATVTYFGTSLSAGQTVKITRSTPILEAEQAVDFTAGAVLTEENFETSRRQLLHAIQELTDTAVPMARGLVSLDTQAIEADQSATWYETAGNRFDFATTAAWDADNEADRGFTLVGGNLRLTAGTWRLSVNLGVSRAAAGSDTFDWRIRDTVSGASGVNYFTAVGASVPLGAKSFYGAAEITLTETTNVRLFGREDAASAGLTLDPDSTVYIQRIA